jgi:hypothetical protein
LYQERQAAQQVLMQFKEHELAWTRCHKILLEAATMETKVLANGWSILIINQLNAFFTRVGCSFSPCPSWTTSLSRNGRFSPSSKAKVIHSIHLASVQKLEDISLRAGIKNCIVSLIITESGSFELLEVSKLSLTQGFASILLP